jgi:hypothetical protein
MDIGEVVHGRSSRVGTGRGTLASVLDIVVILEIEGLVSTLKSHFLIRSGDGPASVDVLLPHGGSERSAMVETFIVHFQGVLSWFKR